MNDFNDFDADYDDDLNEEELVLEKRAVEPFHSVSMSGSSARWRCSSLMATGSPALASPQEASPYRASRISAIPPLPISAAHW